MSSHYLAMLSRMKYINRWGLMRNTRAENLSEHSLETAFIAHAMCMLANARLGKSLNADRAAVLAMFHDTTEIITGDMPTPVKYDNSIIRDEYKKVEARAAERLISLLPPDLRDGYVEYYGEADAELSAIVHAADKISAYIKCIEEQKMGNGEFRDAEKSIKAAIDKMNLPEAELFMNEFAASYALTLDEQNT